MNNLPMPITRFIGRERELEELSRLLRAARLLTLTGVGGCGKTRLALEIASTFSDSFPDGVWWVDLAGLMDDSLVPHQVGSSLGLAQTRSQSVHETLVHFLQPKQVLLLLDNCEHLIDACAQLVDYLLPACPGLNILTTGREPLGLFGETVFQVPGLAVPSSPADLPLTSLLQYDGIRLFVERVQGIKPDFVLTKMNARAVIEICERLDGLPLAIELAAARAKLLTVEHIVERLSDRFSLLTTGSRTALPRHQTLRATIDWSYDFLPDEARLVFHRLSVFAGGFSLEAAGQICSDEQVSATGVLDLLGRLLDRSLISIEQKDGNERFRMLETIRQYASEKLIRSGEKDEIRNQHLAYFLSLAQQGEPNLAGVEAPGWLAQMELEQDNLRAAMDWAAESGEFYSGLALATALLRFWRIHGPVSEGLAYLKMFLRTTEGSTQLALKARALFAAANLAWWQSDFQEARPWYEASLGLGRRLEDKRITGWALFALGALNQDEGNTELAQRLCQEALILLQQVDDKWGAAEARTVLAILAWRRGDIGEARQLFESQIAEEQAISSEIGLANASCWLAYVDLDAADPERAQSLVQQSLTIDMRIGAKNYTIDRLEAMSGVAALRGDLARAARLLGASERLRQAMEYPRNALAQEFYSRHLKTLHAHLDDPALRQAWLEGQVMPLEQAVEYAMEPAAFGERRVQPTTSSEAGNRKPGGLTARECEVAIHIAQGESNREIAERLVVTERTVETHVSNILNKLGFSTRGQIRQWAKEQGLTKGAS